MPPYITTGGQTVDLGTGQVLTSDDYRQIAAERAIQYGVDPDIFLRQINQESGFQVAPSGVDENGNPLPNGSGAIGIAQIVPKWHPTANVNDPIASLDYAAKLMASHLANNGGDYAKALGAYNAGQSNVDNGNYLDPGFADGQTTNYINTILGSGGGNVAGPDSPHTDGPNPPIILSPLTPEQVAKIEQGVNRDGKLTPWQTAGQDYNTWVATTRSKGAAAEAAASANLARTIAETNNIGASSRNSAASQAQSGQQAAASLAEQQRQFNETMGMNKAINDQNQGQKTADREVHKGDTLLGLGSRPDTLIKYLYAIRGQQTPQAVAGTTTNLPGYAGQVGQPQPQAVGPAPLVQPTTAPAAPAAQAPRLAPLPTLAGPQLSGFIGTPESATAQVNQQRANNNPTPNPVDGPATAANPYGSAGGTALTSDTANFFSRLAGMGVFASPPKAMAAGGVIPEPVMGIGMHSGQTYTFGEQGPEQVIPNGAPQTPQIGGGQNSYAAGGTIGYDPSVPGPSANVFNPPELRNVVSRGYNSSPQTPLFPQIGIATNGGQSLIPSAQRLNSLLPSEQSLYSGALQDEFGVVPEDVFSMTRRLAPQVSGLRTPKFAN